jgi:hypothetical protein
MLSVAGVINSARPAKIPDGDQLVLTQCQQGYSADGQRNYADQLN